MLANKFDGAATVGRLLVLCYKEFVDDGCSNKLHWQNTSTSKIELGGMHRQLGVIGGI